MTPELSLYDFFVKRLVKAMASPEEDLVHAAIGISGEAGELLDAVKKCWVYNKPLDKENVVEELGDLFFYFTTMRLLLDISLLDILRYNVNKLEERYPDGYSDAAAQFRADKQPEKDAPCE